MVFFLAAGAACADEKVSAAQTSAAPNTIIAGGIVENSALGASFLDTAKPKSHHGSQTMTVEGINDQGWIVGRWTDSAGHSHRFLMNLFLPAFSDIANHGAAGVQVWTISDSGQLTMDTDKSGYITCMKVSGGQCGSRAPVEVNANKLAPALVNSAWCASGCRFADAQATVQ
jgi:hypothetical protein